MEKHDLDIIYEQLKDKFDLLLTNTFSLDAGYSIDVKVLCGTSVIGTFNLYKEDDDWDEFVFTVELAKPRRSLFPPFSIEKHTHWHPQTIEQAMKDVVAFMNGTLKGL